MHLIFRVKLSLNSISFFGSFCKLSGQKAICQAMLSWGYTRAAFKAFLIYLQAASFDLSNLICPL
jgi:hypothetical protein